MLSLNLRTCFVVLLLCSLWLMSACVDEYLVDHSLAVRSTTDVTPGEDMSTGMERAEMLARLSPLHDGVTVDGDVYRGEYIDGTEYEGIEGTVVEVDLTNRPTWLLALWHASVITRDGGLALTPDEILAAGVVSSKLECEGAGCFGLESSVHWDPLTRFFPTRFPAGERASFGFASSALVFAYDQRLSNALWAKDTPDPQGWFVTHGDATFVHQALYVAHVWSAWWEGFGVMFSSCQDVSMSACVSAVPDERRYIQDQLGALEAVHEALSQSREPRIAIGREDVQRYLDEVSWLFPQRDEASVSGAVDAAFAGATTLDTPAQLVGMIDALHGALVRTPREPWMRAALCAQRVLEPEVCR